MTTEKTAAEALDDIRVHVKFKLLALWSAVMFCYVYGDYFELHRPGNLQGMLAGRTPLGPASQGMLLGMAAVMAVPCLMGTLSLLLPARFSRWLNLVFGAVFTLIELLMMKGTWHFYIFFAAIEAILTVSIVWCAWTWPKQPLGMEHGPALRRVSSPVKRQRT